MKGMATSSFVSYSQPHKLTAAISSHLPHAGLDASRASTGVVWCTERASEYGFLEEPDKWANLGRMPSVVACRRILEADSSQRAPPRWTTTSRAASPGP